MTQRGQWLAVGGVLLAIGAVVAAGVALSGDLARVSVGSRAPAFKAVNLATGDTVALSQFQGEVVLLNIWATWCLPCEQEMPSIQRLHQELTPEGLKIIAVSIDEGAAAGVRRWLEARKLTFEVLLDRPHRIERLYQTTGVPESFVIDRQGVIVKKVIGASPWDAPPQKALFRRLLGEVRTEPVRTEARTEAARGEREQSKGGG